MKRVTCIIPCFNTAKTCLPVIESSLEFCDHLVLVNDGSKDNTLEVLEKFQKRHPEKSSVISFQMNQGKGKALLSGFKKALLSPFDILVTLDGDQQHLPSEIPKIADQVAKGNDFVIGSRNFKKMPFRSKFSNIFISKCLGCFFKKAPFDTQSGFRGFSHPFAKIISEKMKGGRYETEFEILLFALEKKYRIAETPIKTIYPKDRVTYFRKITDSYRVLKVLYEHWRQK